MPLDPERKVVVVSAVFKLTLEIREEISRKFNNPKS
jgi:hypothetical protein